MKLMLNWALGGEFGVQCDNIKCHWGDFARRETD